MELVDYGEHSYQKLLDTISQMNGIMWLGKLSPSKCENMFDNYFKIINKINERKKELKEKFEEEQATEEKKLSETDLKERMTLLSDTYQQYLVYLIQSKGMSNAEVYKRAIVDKKTFAKIKANEHYHPAKLTALQLCVGAKLNLDETRDLLARAGYALSPCDKTDVIFSYFIENGIYDMIEIDIQLEEHGEHCIVV